MPRFKDLSRLDLVEISRRALGAGVAVLCEAVRRRSRAAPAAIIHAITHEDRATLRIGDRTLIRHERGDVGLAPAPFLAPDAADRDAVRAAIVESLRKDLM